MWQHLDQELQCCCSLVSVLNSWSSFSGEPFKLVNKSFQRHEDAGAKKGRVPPTLTKSVSTLLLASLFISNFPTQICVYVCFPSSFFVTRFLLTKQNFPASRWKAALSNTTTESNGAWILPLFTSAETHFNLVTQLLDFLCGSDAVSFFPRQLVSISTWSSASSSLFASLISSARLSVISTLTEMTLLSF